MCSVPFCVNCTNAQPKLVVCKPVHLCVMERPLTWYVMGIYRAPADGVTVQQRWRKDARALEREEEVCTHCLTTHFSLWC